jgi:hypothetical protein
MFHSLRNYSNRSREDCDRIAKEEFAENDMFAKEVVFSWIKQVGGKVINEDEAYYSHDFIAEIGGKEQKVEVERKKGWRHHTFPFSTLSVPHRKHTSRADLFFEVNYGGTAMAMCPMSVIQSSPVIRKNTKYGTINEPFYDVPISKFRFYYLEDGVWMEDVDE